MKDLKWEDKIEISKCFDELIQEYNEEAAKKVISALHPFAEKARFYFKFSQRSKKNSFTGLTKYGNIQAEDRRGAIRKKSSEKDR